MSSFEQTLTTFFTQRPSLCDASSFLVALSGGRDSLSLLHWLAHSPQITNKLTAVYVDHGLRPEAAQEGAMLKAMLAPWGVSLITRQADLTASTFSENSGRQARYTLLREVANQQNARAILTGHHAADQAETVLLHLLRGSGLKGLTGMRHESKLEPFDLIRPMLDTTPEMIAAYAAKHHLTPLEDPSNQDQKFARNKLRHDLLPKLAADYNPKIAQGLSRMARILQDDWDALEKIHQARWEMCQLEIGEVWCTIDHEIWRTASASFQRYALRNLYSQLHQSTQDLTLENLESARIGLLEQKPDKQYQLSGSILTQFMAGKIVASTKITTSLFDVPQVNVDKLSIGTAAEFEHTLADNRWQLNVKPISPSEIDLAEAKNNPWLAFISVSNDHPIEMRTRQVGESFQPFGMQGNVSLKKLMIDRKIPAFLRDRWPIIADDHGALWLPGHRLAARAAVTDQTHKILKLTFSTTTANS